MKPRSAILLTPGSNGSDPDEQRRSNGDQQVRKPGPSLVGSGRGLQTAARHQPDPPGLDCIPCIPRRCQGTGCGLRWRDPDGVPGRGRGAGHRPGHGGGTADGGPAACIGFRRRDRIPGHHRRSPGNGAPRTLRPGHLPGDAGTRAGLWIHHRRLRGSGQTRCRPVLLHHQPQSPGLGHGGGGCRVRAATAAPGYPRLRQVHQAPRAGRRHPAGGPGRRVHDRAALQPIHPESRIDPGPGRELSAPRAQARP